MSWEDAITEIQALHSSKRKDYGSDADPWANLRVAQLYGVPAWLHASMLVDHKSRRIQTFAEKGKLEHEGVRDSLIDRCVYALAALVLFDEDVEGDGSSSSHWESRPEGTNREGVGAQRRVANSISPSTYCPECHSMTREYRDKFWSPSPMSDEQGAGRWIDCTNGWHDAAD